MAKSTFKTETVVTTTVTLLLSGDGALTLRRLLGCHIVGPSKGPRGVLDGVFDSLQALDGQAWDRSGVSPFNVSRNREDTLWLESDERLEE